MARTLTAANAVITLAVPGLFPVPQQLHGFSADNVYESPGVDVNETAMGVDGYLSAGFVFNHIEQTFTLQADSLSNDMFEQWDATMRQVRDTYFAEGTTTLPSLQRRFVSQRGVLVNLPKFPTANKITQPRRYTIRWQSVTAVSI